MDFDPDFAERPHEDESCQSANGFVPNVLRRILSFVHPADQVLCKNTHWLLASVASRELHYRIAVPKHGMLIIQWPVCFHSSDDDVSCHVDVGASFIKLLRFNINKSKTSAKQDSFERLQQFLAGFSRVTLQEVSCDLSLYANITTLFISLDTNESYLPDFYHHGIPQKNNHGKFCHETRLFAGWQKWSQIIAAIMDVCAASLLHLIFNDSVACDVANVPSEFYAGLKFDEKLAKMRNLQTIYLPTLADYERACSQANPDSKSGWQALHAIPVAERLPNLNRVVFSSADDFSFLTSALKLPVIAARGVLTEIGYSPAGVYTDDSLPTQASYLQTIFPDARVVSKRFREWREFRVDSDKHIPPFDLNAAYWSRFPLAENYSLGWSSNSSKRQYVEEAVKCVASYVEKRAESLSVWNHVRAHPKPPKVTIDIDVWQQEYKFNRTLSYLLGGENSFVQMIQHLARPRILIGLQEEKKYYALYHLLPFFDAVHHPTIAFSADAVKTIHLSIMLDHRHYSLARSIDSMRRSFGVNSCNHFYTLPAIELFLGDETTIEPSDDDDDESRDNYDGDNDLAALFDRYITLVESKLTKVFVELLNDAVSSCVVDAAGNNRRGLKFSMYQALESIDGYFVFLLPEFVYERLGINDKTMRPQFMSDCAVRFEQFRQRVWDEMFNPVVMFGDADDLFSSSQKSGADKFKPKASANVRAAVNGVLPLPRIKKFKFDWSFNP